MPPPRASLPAELRRTACTIRTWRRDRARRPLSPELWRQAAELARRHGVSATARALRVDYYALKRRVAAAAEPASSFVEWVPAPGPAPCVVELCDGRGATMRVQLPGDDAAARLEALARVFWGRHA